MAPVGGFWILFLVIAGIVVAGRIRRDAPRWRRRKAQLRRAREAPADPPRTLEPPRTRADADFVADAVPVPRPSRPGGSGPGRAPPVPPLPPDTGPAPAPPPPAPPETVATDPPAAPLAPLLARLRRLPALDPARGDALDALAARPLAFDLEVTDAARTVDYQADAERRDGRTLRGRLAGTEQEVVALLPASDNAFADGLAAGRPLHLEGRWMRWDALYDRAVLAARRP